MWALGGFVPRETKVDDEEYWSSRVAFKSRNPLIENEYRLCLVTQINQFLEVLRAGGTTKKACASTRLNRTRVEELRRQIPTFAQLWDEVLRGVTDELEAAGLQRAIHGVEVPIYHMGIRVGTKKVYSDTILVRMLEGRDPTYKSRVSAELTGKDGAPLPSASVGLNITPDQLRDIGKQLLEDV